MRTDLWGPLVRRWYVVLVGLVLTVAMAFMAAGGSTEAQYQSGATVVLIPSRTTAGEDGNPLLYLGDLVVARDALLRIMGDPLVNDEIVGGQPGASYSIQVDPDTPGPMMVITATAASADAASALRDRVVKEMPKQLRGLQVDAGTPRRALITMLPLSQDEEPTGGGGSNKRRLLVVLVAGLGLTVLSAGLLDSWLSSRRKDPEDEDEGSNSSVDAPDERSEELDAQGGADHWTPDESDDRSGDSATASQG